MALGQVHDEVQEQREEEEVDDALAAFGFFAVRPAAEFEDLYLWPENLACWQLFQAVATQWNVGPSGPIGLNYLAVEMVRKHRGFKNKEWSSSVFEEIQAMELATLAAWKERAE